MSKPEGRSTNGPAAEFILPPPIAGFGPARMGGILVILFFGVFLGWSSLSPLSSAAVASGSVVAFGQTKIIQHFEGGIIEAILVRNGDKVDVGQPLIQLSNKQAIAARNLHATRLYAMLATRDRILVEQRGLDRVIFAPELLARAESSEDFQNTLESQQLILETKNKTFNGQADLLRARIEQLIKQSGSYRAQLDATRQQTELISLEIADVSVLLKKGLAQRPRLLELQRRKAMLLGQTGEFEGEIARVGEAIGEVRIQILDLENRHMADLSGELEEVQNDIAEARERFSAASDILKRTAIIAPVTGTVTGLRYFTLGGVVEPGAPVLEIVPAQDNPIIEARLNPLDIDDVLPGMKAQIHLSSYTGRKSVPLRGKVIHIAANSTLDPNLGITYYLVRIVVDPDQLEKHSHLKLYPGMPAEVMIQIGDRTLLDYLIGPLKQSLRRSFNET